MAAAVKTLGDRMADEFMSEAQLVGQSSERIGRLLDLVWNAHRGPLFSAALELWVAARTDAALHAAMNDVANAQAVSVTEAIVGAFPDLAARPGFAESVMIGLATLTRVGDVGFGREPRPGRVVAHREARATHRVLIPCLASRRQIHDSNESASSPVFSVELLKEDQHT